MSDDFHCLVAIYVFQVMSTSWK